MIEFISWFSKYNLVPLGMSLKMCLLNKDVVEKDFNKEFVKFKVKKSKNKFLLNAEQNPGPPGPGPRHLQNNCHHQGSGPVSRPLQLVAWAALPCIYPVAPETVFPLSFPCRNHSG